MPQQPAYLLMTNGLRSGSNYVLDPAAENRIGRGLDCQVVLTDPLSSRVHAIVVYGEEGWWVRDAGSRNGTFLNGQRVEEARLVDGCSMSIGQARFSFHEGSPQSAPPVAHAPHLTQTVVLDTPVESRTPLLSASPRDEAQVQDLLDLYHLAITLLGCSDPEEVVQESLSLLQQRAQASVVGFLWVDDQGTLKPKRVIPAAAAEKVVLSESLTQLVIEKRRAVRVNCHSDQPATESLRVFADAICIPLISDERTLGAIHLYLEEGRFKERDFEVALSVANVLVTALSRAREWVSLRVAHDRLVDQSAGFAELVGESPPMVSLKKKITKVARAAGCVLIRGESGCGKELVARAIHRVGPRADRPMLSVNCAAIPRDLMESQLFGHKKGAFTGAEQDHVGWFEQADSGTLFLDEVGEMTLEGQAKLLRILEGHPFLPVGGHEEVEVDVRVIAATNRELSERVQAGQFREDLYYRLEVFELIVPPLRERSSDIGILIDFFLAHFRKHHNRPELGLSDAARQKMLAYQWPGNVRQLRNLIDSAVVLADGPEIQAEDLGLREATGDQFSSLRIDEWERKLIPEALRRTGGSIPEAAKLLGIGRATLYRKVDEYGVRR